MARGLEAGGFRFVLEVEEEEGGMTWVFVVVVVVGKEKGEGGSIELEGRQVCEGWGWEDRVLFFISYCLFL